MRLNHPKKCMEVVYIFIVVLWGKFIFRRRNAFKFSSARVEPTIAMASSSKALAEKVLKPLDWEALAKAVVSDEGRRELSNLRRAYDEVSNIIQTKFTLTPKPIDWNFYREKLNPAIVDIFQKSYESLKIPPYEDNITPEYIKKHEALMVKVAEQEEVSRKEIAKCREQLKKIREQKEAIKTMTADEYFAQHPEVKAKFDEEIKNHNWGY